MGHFDLVLNGEVTFSIDLDQEDEGQVPCSNTVYAMQGCNFNIVYCFEYFSLTLI